MKQEILMHRTGVALVAIWLSAQASALGLISYAWTFDELKKKSDVVVVASRIRTQSLGVKAVITDVQPPFPVVELNTEFKMLTVLKGATRRSTIVLRHYRKDADRMRGAVVNGPIPLDFSDEPTTVYLLFLKRETDGRYTPTSGPVVPGVSVIPLPRNSLTVFPR